MSDDELDDALADMERSIARRFAKMLEGDLMWYPSGADLLELCCEGPRDIVDRCQAHHPAYRSPETNFCFHPDHDPVLPKEQQ